MANIVELPQSPSGEIDHNTVREKINEVIGVINSGIKRVNSFEYANNSPVVGTEYDTLYNPALSVEPTTEISAIAVISSGGETYALFNRVSATAAVNSPDVKVGITSEFPGVAGDAEMIFWYDSVTSSIHMDTDFDGSGKTLVSLQIVTAYETINLP